MNPALISTTTGIAALVFAFWRLERSRFSSKEISLITALAAIAAAGRIPCAVIPGVQPTTFMVVLSGFVFGPATGFYVGAVAALASNILLGQGPWTIWQMIGWGLCGISAGMLGAFRPRAGKVALTVFGAAWGYLFGWLMNSWYWFSFIHPLSFQTWVMANAASFPFDTAHAVGNAAFMLALGEPFISALRFFRKRLELSLLTPYTIDTPCE